jgi:hypothetical protein
MVIKFLKHFKQSRKSSDIIYLENYTDYCSTSSYNISGKASKLSYQEFTKIVSNRTYSADDLIGRPFPVAIRAIDDNRFVIERPPFKTSIRFTPTRAARVKKEASVLCEVWIPWTVAIVTLPTKLSPDPQVRLFFNDGPLSSIEDQLAPLLTPNAHYGAGHLCWGQTDNNWREEVESGRVSADSIADIYYFYINDYFNGGWNLDLGLGQLATLTYREIGKFTNSPLDKPELVERAKQSKLKITNIDTSSRDSTRVKNSYYVWSLLTLEEVLFSITKFKETFPGSSKYLLKQVLNELNLEDNKTEVDYLKLISNSISSIAHSVHWEFNITYNEDFISKINEKASALCLSLNSYNHRLISKELFSEFYNENTTPFLNSFKKALSTIVDTVDSYDSMENKPVITITYSMDDILNPVVAQGVLC